MAIYHAHVKIFSRSKGQSAIAAAAYRAGMLLTDPATGRHHNYRFRNGVVETRCIAPHDAPDWAFEPGALWAAVEAAEKRKDATLAREFEVALPHELSDDQRVGVAMALADELVTRYRFAMQVSIHRPAAEGSLNHHVHMMATTRRIGPLGLDGKTRELDGGATGRAEVEWTRQMVARVINQHLEQAAVSARVDHRSLEDQRANAESRGDLAAALVLTREPTIHLGKHATALERKGEATALGAFNGAIGQVPPRAADALSHPDEIRITPKAKPRSNTPRLATVEGRRGAAREAYAEARQLWATGTVGPSQALFVYTPRILSYYAARLKAHIDTQTFAVHLRQLVRYMKAVVHETGRLLREQAAEKRAKAEWEAARKELQAFDAEHPKPMLWPRREWQQRRDRRLTAVSERRSAWRKAREAIGEDAQQRYAQELHERIQSLENWSAEMLQEFPVDADSWTPDMPRFSKKEEPPAPPEQDDRQGGSQSGTRPYRPKF